MSKKSIEKTMIFDDVFRTMAQKMPQLMVALINEVFGTEYSVNDIDNQHRNEFMEEGGKIVTDSIFRIKGHIYHLECQSISDSTMVIRMFEYDFAIALEEAMRLGKPYEIRFPESCVLYLRDDGKVKNALEMRVIMPDGQICTYLTKVIKASDYTKEDIFQKNLLCMLPYYILRYEKELDAISGSAEKTRELLEEYRDITDRLQKELDVDEKSAMYVDLIKLIQKISDHVLRNSEALKKEVGNIMGGKVLELESERLRREGLEQGLNQGLEQGLEQGLNQGLKQGAINAIVRMIIKDYSKEQILDLGYTEEEYLRAEKQLPAEA